MPSPASALGVVHRGRPSRDGAVTFAKTSKALARLNEMILWARSKRPIATESCPDPEEELLHHIPA